MGVRFFSIWWIEHGGVCVFEYVCAGRGEGERLITTVTKQDAIVVGNQERIRYKGSKPAGVPS